MFALGRLCSLTLKAGTVVTFNEASNLLIYDPKHKDLLICKPLKHTEKPGDNDADYAQFHARMPDGKIDVDWFVPSKATCIDLGLIKAINYYIPANFSSSKADKEYKHSFGDFGKGFRSYEPGMLPALWFNGKRKLYYIMRRPDNRWLVDDYIRG